VGRRRHRPPPPPVPLGITVTASGRAPAPIGAALLGAVPPPVLVLTGVISVQVGAGLAARLFTEIPPAAVTGLRLWSAAALLVVAGWRGLATPVGELARGRGWRDAAVVAAFGVTLAIMNFSIYQA